MCELYQFTLLVLYDAALRMIWVVFGLDHFFGNIGEIDEDAGNDIAVLVLFFDLVKTTITVAPNGHGEVWVIFLVPGKAEFKCQRCYPTESS